MKIITVDRNYTKTWILDYHMIERYAFWVYIISQKKTSGRSLYITEVKSSVMLEVGATEIEREGESEEAYVLFLRGNTAGIKVIIIPIISKEINV